MTTQTNTLWQDFLQSQVNSIKPTKSQLVAADQGNVIADLSFRGLLKLSGEDAFSFLQGQVTNDVKLLDGAHSQYAGYCNPKGRLLALFFAFSIKNEIYLEFDKALLENIMKRLRMYVMRSKVAISEESILVRIGIAGKESEQHLGSLFSTIPKNPHELRQYAETSIIRLPSQTPMFEVCTSQDKAIQIWQALANSHTIVSKTGWDWLEIQAGLPEVSLNTQEAFVPQMVNLDALDGINFKKGCYTGQEIVARTHYLGKVKRRTQRMTVLAEVTPEAGDEIHDAQQQVIGQIVRICPALDEGFDLLAECRLESLDQGQLFWKDHPLKLESIPYTL